MHELDSVMVSLDAFDTVTVAERADGDIRVRFINADIDGVNNTAYAAARAVGDILGAGWDIEIEKGIPEAAGLGGSSADGAAVLRALDLFYRLPARGIDMRALALGVGSDVPFMLTGGACRVRGVGDDLFFFDNRLPLFAVGLMSERVSTGEAYARFDDIYGGGYCPTDNDELVKKLMDGDASALALFKNALKEPAAAIAPSIDVNIKKLEALGATACLTGSGGMVLGWFDDIEKFAACTVALKGEKFKVFSTTHNGILHEWISRE